MFDAIPKRLKLCAVQNLLAHVDGLAVVGVFDVEFTCDLAQDFLDLGQVRSKLVGNRQRPFFQRRAQLVLHLALRVDEVSPFEIFVNRSGLLEPQHG